VGRGEKIDIRKFKYPANALAAESAEGNVEDETVKKINIIIKADFLGSAEAIEESFAKINQAKVKIKIIHKGLGNITEGDIKRAEAAKAVIVGFNIKIPPVMEELAREKNVEIKTYNIIYNLLNDIKIKMQAILGIQIKRVDIGKLKILAVFRTEKNSQIIGGKVIEGRAEANSLLEIARGQEKIGTGKLTRLQAGKQDVSSVECSQECGLQIEGKPIAQKGDLVLLYKEVEVADNI
jgi:translation initiation factor IF-2